MGNEPRHMRFLSGSAGESDEMDPTELENRDHANHSRMADSILVPPPHGTEQGGTDTINFQDSVPVDFRKYFYLN